MRAATLVFVGCSVVAAARSADAQFTRVGTIAGQFDMVKVDGSHLFASAGKTLTIFDVSTPTAITLLGAFSFPEEIWSFRVVGQDVYVGTNFYGLAVLDVSTPTAPKLRASYKTPGQAKAASPYGTKVVVVDHMQGLVLVDLSTPSRPVSLGSFFVDGYARDVVTVGPLAYAVDSPTGFYVLDLSASGPLEPVSTLQSGNGLRTVDVLFGADGKTPRGAVLVGNGAVQLYDLSNPRSPAKAGSLRTPGGALRVALSGARAYVADAREGLTVVDLASLSEPRIVGSFKTPLIARDVALAGETIFIATGGPDGAGDVLVVREAR